VAVSPGQWAVVVADSDRGYSGDIFMAAGGHDSDEPRGAASRSESLSLPRGAAE
jgi:hypothetical protein